MAETAIKLIELKPFTSNYRKGCGWYVTIKFSLGDKWYISKALVADLYKEILEYNNETSIFTFKQYVTETVTTNAALTELENIQKGNINSSYISPVDRYILHCIEVLNIFWD